MLILKWSLLHKAPSYEPYEVYEEEPLPDLTPIVVAILTLIGLSLLFPTFVQLEDVQGRKKRSAEIISERTAEIYNHLNEVLEPVDRGCMEKLTCEVGALSYDAGLTSHPYLKWVDFYISSHPSTVFFEYRENGWYHFKSYFNVQPWPLAYKRLLNKPYVNEVFLRGKNLPYT